MILSRITSSQIDYHQVNSFQHDKKESIQSFYDDSKHNNKKIVSPVNNLIKYFSTICLVIKNLFSHFFCNYNRRDMTPYVY